MKTIYSKYDGDMENTIVIGQVGRCQVCKKKVFVETILKGEHSERVEFNIVCWECIPEEDKEQATQMYNLDESETEN